MDLLSLKGVLKQKLIKVKKIITFIKFIHIIIAAICLNGCQQQQSLSTGEGYINVDGGKVWYRVTGKNSKIPILVLHGGPGFPGYYLKPLDALGKDRQVIFYDQLGCGRSDRITDTTLMT